MEERIETKKMLAKLRKILVVTISILSFGLITPPPSFLYEKAEANEFPNGNVAEDSNCSATIQEGKTYQSFTGIEPLQEGNINNNNQSISLRDIKVEQMLKEAEEQSFKKFGNRIKPIIEDEFKEIILPKIEEVLASLVEQYKLEDLQYLEITEEPTGGNSEKIFHVIDKKKNKDILLFHVRKDHPPLDGYWFNFHYHTYIDQFQAHHDLGSLYWDKNTPPKWMS